MAGLSPPVADAVRRVVVAGFRALWDGRSPTRVELADAGPAAEAIGHLHALGRLELSDDGCVVGVPGLTLRPTPHRIEHDGGEVHTWCAIDAIGIPAALGIEARAVTSCPCCRRELVVTISGGVPAALGEAVLWQPAWSVTHLRNDFCSAANLFCSPGHLHQWATERNATGTAMTLDEAAALGRQLWADVSEREGV